MNVSISTYRAEDAPVAQRDAFSALAARQWPMEPGETLDPEFAAAVRPMAYTLVTQGEMVLGGCNWVSRRIAVRKSLATVAGLASVLIDEPHRGQGLAARMLHNACEWAHKEGFEWGVLFTGGTMPDYYARFGWQTLRGRLLVFRDGRDEPIEEGDFAMAKPFSRAAELAWPAWESAPMHLGNGQW